MPSAGHRSPACAGKAALSAQADNQPVGRAPLCPYRRDFNRQPFTLKIFGDLLQSQRREITWQGKNISPGSHSS